MNNEVNNSDSWQVFDFIISVITGIIGYEIHGSIFWSIMDVIFYPIAWIKWLLLQEVSISIIKDAFDFFLN